jgi:hypothetical protein
MMPVICVLVSIMNVESSRRADGSVGMPMSGLNVPRRSGEGSKEIDNVIRLSGLVDAGGDTDDGDSCTKHGLVLPD